MSARSAGVRPSRRAILIRLDGDPVGPLVPDFGCCWHWRLTVITRPRTGRRCGWRRCGVTAIAVSSAAPAPPMSTTSSPAPDVSNHRPRIDSTICAACARATTRRSRSTSPVRTASSAAMAAARSSAAAASTAGRSRRGPGDRVAAVTKHKIGPAFFWAFQQGQPRGKAPGRRPESAGKPPAGDTRRLADGDPRLFTHQALAGAQRGPR